MEPVQVEEVDYGANKRPFEEVEEEEEEEEDQEEQEQEEEEDDEYQDKGNTKSSVDQTDGKKSDSNNEIPSPIQPPVEEPSYVDVSTLTPFEGTTLPYELSTLQWDRQHRRNAHHCYCYCGKPRSQFTTMLQCGSCKQWFHSECFKQKPKNLPLPGDWAYNFKCALCTKNVEDFHVVGKNWTDIVRVAIYNLLVEERKRKGNKKFFQYKEEICSFIDKHWDSLCDGKTRTKTWENTIGSALSTKSHYFRSGAEELGSAGYWGLRSEDDPTFVKEGAAKSLLKKSGGAKKKGSASSSGSSLKGLTKQPPKKKKFAVEVTNNLSDTGETGKSGKTRKVKAPPLVYFPRLSYDPNYYGYKEMVLAKENSAPQVKIMPDRLTLYNEKGYRMARASFGSDEGSWYYEVDILDHRGNVRLGWCTEKGDIQAPVGYDIYSYSYRDKEGTRFHQSRGNSYGEAYGPGDTIGFYINLPPKPKKEENEDKKENQAPVVNQLPINPPPLGTKKKEEIPNKLEGSEIIFYKNGVSQGVAYSNIFQGHYYPAGSLYGGAIVRFNFGPNFKFPPKDKEYKPCTDMVVIVEPQPEAPLDTIMSDKPAEQQQPQINGNSITLAEPLKMEIEQGAQ